MFPIKEEKFGHVQVESINVEKVGQTHELPDIYAFVLVHLHSPACNVEPLGQLHAFEILRELTPQVQDPACTKAPGVEQLHCPDCIGSPVSQVHSNPIIVEPYGHSHYPLYIIALIAH